MIRVGIITASDKGARGEREDQSGQVIRALVAKEGWEVTRYQLLPDEREQLANQMRVWCDQEAVDLILTTGGTGFSQRDCMPEATLDVVERQVPGIPEAMRHYSLQITPKAMLSRSMAGIRGKTLILNLPGSPKAVQENLSAVIGTLAHGIEILQGSASECGNSGQGLK